MTYDNAFDVAVQVTLVHFMCCERAFSVLDRCHICSFAVLGRLHIAQLISTATYKITGFPALLLADVACDFPVSVMSSLTKYNIMHTFQPNAC